jgi:cyclic pyranopterin phosphate synthase
LRDCGVRRVNVSVDTLNPEKFTEITRRGRLDQVLEGLAAAKRESAGRALLRASALRTLPVARSVLQHNPGGENGHRRRLQ